MGIECSFLALPTCSLIRSLSRSLEVVALQPALANIDAHAVLQHLLNQSKKGGGWSRYPWVNVLTLQPEHKVTYTVQAA